MSHQTGLILTQDKKLTLANNLPIPKPAKDQILIKNVAGALNPVDWKQIEFGFGIPSYPYVLGLDIAGIVEEVGEGVTKFKKGDKVFTANPSGKQGFGAYQEYTLAIADLSGKIPDNISFEEAATLGMGSATSFVALFNDLKVPPPWHGKQQLPSDTILIWGGSTSLGLYGIQLAKLSGFKNIITTSSPHNFELVKSLGATHVFDYHDSDVAKKIEQAAGGKLKLVFDAFGGSASGKFPNDIVADGGIVSSTLGGKDTPSRITTITTSYAKIFSELHQLGTEFYTYIEGLLASGKYKPNPVQVLSKNLLGIEEGHKLLKSNKVSAHKLVFKIGDMPK